MMNKRIFVAAVLTLVTSALLPGGNAYAAKVIENIDASPIPSGLSDAQIVKAMQSGGATRGWIVKQVEPGHVEATIYVRSHMAKVDIMYDAAAYSIRYNDSENLDYKDGKIHRNYNKWVQNLNMDIQRALAML
jgi:hypothetical protein